MKLINITKIVGISAISIMLVGCGNNSPQPKNNKVNILQGTKGARTATVSMHRESAMLGAALNMYVYINEKKVPQKLYSNDTIINKIKHNGTVVIQVENKVKKITNVKNASMIKCSVSPIFGGEFMKNAFMVNGFEPKMNVELNCNK